MCFNLFLNRTAQQVKLSFEPLQALSFEWTGSMDFRWTEPYMTQLCLHKLSYTKLWILFALSQTQGCLLLHICFFLKKIIYMLSVVLPTNGSPKTMVKTKLTDNI